MRKALITCLALAAALVVAATASGRTDATKAAGAIPGCSPASLNLLAEGTLTIGTDNPAFPPWWGGTPKKPWQVSDPASGKGYESAVAYQIAKRLGFAKGDVKWVAVPFNNSFKPGKKPFDFYMAQVSYKPERAKNVTFSTAYYYVDQAVVGIKGTPIASVRSLAGLRKYKLGAQIGTTSYEYIVKTIKPTRQPSVFDSNADAVAALKNKQIDGLVVDYPSTGYITGVQVPTSKVVGRLRQAGAGREYFGLVFSRGNVLVKCVDKALTAMKADGTLARLERIWLAQSGGAPVLK